MTKQELLVFEVGSAHFAVPLSVVDEVVPASTITPLPSSPPFLLGLAAVRGKVMGVIDSAKRYGLPITLNSYFLVCRVRGNLTAVTIDRAVVAGAVPARALSSEELKNLREQSGVDEKFIKSGFEIFEMIDEHETRALGIHCLEVNPDLFVSAEMASRVGEVA